MLNRSIYQTRLLVLTTSNLTTLLMLLLNRSSLHDGLTSPCIKATAGLICKGSFNSFSKIMPEVLSHQSFQTFTNPCCAEYPSLHEHVTSPPVLLDTVLDPESLLMVISLFLSG